MVLTSNANIPLKQYVRLINTEVSAISYSICKIVSFNTLDVIVRRTWSSTVNTDVSNFGHSLGGTLDEQLPKLHPQS